MNGRWSFAGDFLRAQEKKSRLRTLTRVDCAGKPCRVVVDADNVKRFAGNGRVLRFDGRNRQVWSTGGCASQYPAGGGRGQGRYRDFRAD